MEKKGRYKKGKSPADSAWDMFSATGKISYYLLYKDIIDK